MNQVSLGLGLGLDVIAVVCHDIAVGRCWLLIIVVFVLLCSGLEAKIFQKAPT